MKIIVLKGKANSGKTSSLKKLMLKLLEYPDVRVIYSSKFGTKLPVELSEKINENWYTKANNVIETEFGSYCIETPIVINKKRTNKENYENSNYDTAQELFNEVIKIVNQ